MRRWDRLLLAFCLLATAVGITLGVAAGAARRREDPEPTTIRCGCGLTCRVEGTTLMVGIARGAEECP